MGDQEVNLTPIVVIMGTMKTHPQTFIAIGILRSQLDPAELDKQSGLF